VEAAAKSIKILPLVRFELTIPRYPPNPPEAGAFCLGLWYAEGLRGLPVNIEQSKYWLGKVVDRTCAYPGLSTDARDLADALLDELAHPESGREDDLLDSCGELFRNGESEGQEAEASFNSMNVEDVVASAFVYDA